MFKYNKRKIFFISLLMLVVFVFIKCINKGKTESDFRGKQFAGAAKCSGCHKSIHESFLNTAHNKSSNPATPETIKGNFEPGKNNYYYRADVKVAMEKRGNGLFQVAYMNNVEKQANRFDIAIGSGRKAQTFLYWMDNNVYQLPVSYSVSAGDWVNSPGYPPHQVRFDRNIPIGCFECHSSYIKLEANKVVGTRYINSFDKNRIVYGVDCERCHGPAAEHVSYHEEHPQEKNAKYMISYSSLSRRQQIDMCAVCHSGIQQPLKSTFNFKPGDTLINNFFTASASAKVEDLDVHGNQKQLLEASACYIRSNTLTCTSCHNTHTTERENLALFSNRCMNCHNNDNHNFCSMASKLGESITKNCIDCHMPSKPSKLIRLLSNGAASPTPDLIRTHYIAIYPEETKRFLSQKK